jgi:hypothetical protein
VAVAVELAVGVLVRLAVAVGVRVGVGVGVRVGVGVAAAAILYGAEVVVVRLPPSPVGLAATDRVMLPPVAGLVTPARTMVTVRFFATATGEVNAATVPARWVNVTALPLNVPLVIVAASVPAGNVTVMPATPRSHPFVLGVPVVIV